ncbi:hypothetical protein AAVH_05794 [Aphelenchoides avenae]|nr:hypothetical protein AAVH_05794 [Aphelenchus avenae]
MVSTRSAANKRTTAVSRSSPESTSARRRTEASPERVARNVSGPPTSTVEESGAFKMPIGCGWCDKQYAQRSGLNYHRNRKPAEITIEDNHYGISYTFVTCQGEKFASIRRRLLENRLIKDRAVFQVDTRIILDEETFRSLDLKPDDNVRVFYLPEPRI